MRHNANNDQEQQIQCKNKQARWIIILQTLVGSFYKTILQLFLAIEISIGDQFVSFHDVCVCMRVDRECNMTAGLIMSWYSNTNTIFTKTKEPSKRRLVNHHTI